MLPPSTAIKQVRIFPDPGIFLHRLQRPGTLGQPALVPGGGRHQLTGHHVLLPLLPLSSRASQQAPGQLADGGKWQLYNIYPPKFP